MHVVIDRLWDGRVAHPGEVARLELTRTPDGLEVFVDAPYHGDRAPPSEPGPTDGLWEYEVVELFLAPFAAGLFNLGRKLVLGRTADGAGRVDEDDRALKGRHTFLGHHQDERNRAVEDDRQDHRREDEGLRDALPTRPDPVALRACLDHRDQTLEWPWVAMMIVPWLLIAPLMAASMKRSTEKAIDGMVRGMAQVRSHR